MWINIGLTMIDIRDCPLLCLLKGITMYHGRTLLEHGSPFTGTQLFTNQLLCVLFFVGYCKTPGWKQKKQDHLTSIRLTYAYSERLACVAIWFTAAYSFRLGKDQALVQLGSACRCSSAPHGNWIASLVGLVPTFFSRWTRWTSVEPLSFQAVRSTW